MNTIADASICKKVTDAIPVNAVLFFLSFLEVIYCFIFFWSTSHNFKFLFVLSLYNFNNCETAKFLFLLVK